MDYFLLSWPNTHEFADDWIIFNVFSYFFQVVVRDHKFRDFFHYQKTSTSNPFLPLCAHDQRFLWSLWVSYSIGGMVHACISPFESVDVRGGCLPSSRVATQWTSNLIRSVQPWPRNWLELNLNPSCKSAAQIFLNPNERDPTGMVTKLSYCCNFENIIIFTI